MEIVGLLRQLVKTRPAAVEGGFDRRNGAVHHAADLLQRIAEHIHQDDAAPLRHRKAHEGPQAGGRDLAVLHVGKRVDDHVHILIGAAGVLPSAAAQMIKRGIVRDAKQPAFRIGDRSGRGKGFDRLHQRFLDHILAVDDRAGHAGAVAMQLRSQGAEESDRATPASQGWPARSWERRKTRDARHLPSIR